MKIATKSDLTEVISIFAPYQKKYFPHVRTDYLEREINNGNVILENGVVIVFKRYKRVQKIGNHQAQKNDVILKQIVTKNQGSGTAWDVMQTFIREMDTNIWLTVREENHRARRFYEKLGMKNVGNISWSAGKIPGIIYLLEKNSEQTSS